MAKKVLSMIKLQVEAGKANPSPPIGPAWASMASILWIFASRLMLRRPTMKG